MKHSMKIAVSVILITILALTFSGCSGNVVTQTVTVTEEASYEGIMYYESFNENATNWTIYTNDSGSVALKDGALHILNYTNDDGYSCETYPNISLTDFILVVEMTFVGGSQDNIQSVIGRYSDDKCYYFDISAEGYYAIGYWDDIAYEYTALLEPAYSDYILQGNNTNTVRVECIGTSLSLTVNGHLLAQINDSTCTTGYVGLELASMDGEYTEVAYDNFFVYEP
jgi:hypothetical protein